ncbi:MAG: lipoate--protein ligase family protein [Gammaproteobacteria bacterium]|nr:lipoate--protein ligase family protein [Gammaproteobacteria bacterium]
MQYNARRWRVIDTGLRRAAENMAINQAMLEAHKEGLIPHTLRFLQFTPSALLGYHQSAEQELDLDYCRQQGIEIQRRITGGGAIYFDEAQIGWELYIDKQTLGTQDMSSIAQLVCEAAALGMRRLGVDARFRPRNDIEVDGRKISGTGGAADGDSILYQGSLLVDFDVERMLRVLRVAAEKLSGKSIASARERVANLKDLLGEAPTMTVVKSVMTQAFAQAFGVVFDDAIDLTEIEVAKFHAALIEMDTPQWVHLIQRPRSEAPIVTSLYKCQGGLMRVAIAMDVVQRSIKQIWITGDIFVNPRRMVLDLEAALKDTPIAELRTRIERFFDEYPVEMLKLTRRDFITAIESALASSASAVPIAIG